MRNSLIDQTDHWENFMPTRNFIILIGGPGLYFACDAVHDKAWSNYVVPMQLAAQKKLYQLDNETVHWVVFAPAYRQRWNDDINITSSEKKEKNKEKGKIF
jgi:hypothetical protein